MLPLFPLWHFCHVCQTPTGRLQIHYMKSIHPHTSSAMILNGKLLILFWSKEISLHTLENIKTQTVHFILYCMLNINFSPVTALTLLCILWCCILPTHTCRPRSLGVKNTNRCERQQNGNHFPSLCMLHHTHCTHHFSSCRQCHEMGSRSFHCGWMEILEPYILGSRTAHTPHFTIYKYVLNTSLFRLSS
jgi:hypothetical protein